MKTIVLYYTFGGSTRKEAERIAKDEKDSVLVEVKEQKKRNIFNAFLSGCPKAMKRIKSKIQTIPYNLDEYERIILVCPIWAGFPVPAFNAVVDLLPAGKEVELFLCSGSGVTSKSKEGTEQLIKDRHCKLIGYHDIGKAQ